MLTKISRCNGPRTDAVVSWAGAFVLGLGLVVLAGWLAGSVWIISVGAGRASMKVNTALGLALGGLSLLLGANAMAPRWERAGQVLGGAVAGLGLLSALERLANVDLGIDQLLFGDHLTSVANFPGRMSMATALCFILFGCGRVAAGYAHAYWNACHVTTALFGSVVAYMAIIAYLYDAPILHNPAAVASIAVHTAIGLLVLFIGLMALRPDLGLFARMRSRGPGGALFRLALPAVIIILPVVGRIRLSGELANLYDRGVGLVLFTSINVIAICSIIWLAARQADRMAAERQHAWDALSANQQRLQETADHLGRTSKQLQAIFDSSPVGIIAYDAQRNITNWNAMAEALFGYTAAEVVGRPLPAQTHLYPEISDDSFARSESGEMLRGIESKLVRKDGRIIDIQASVASFFDETDALQGTLSAISDETERNALQRQLQQAQRMEAIGQLTGGLAHDFNNLLGVILGNLDFLQETHEAGSDAWQLTDAALHAATRGAELTNQLLAFARQQPLAPKLTDLNLVLRGLSRLLLRTLGENIRLVLKVSPDLWPVRIDASQLELAILNLSVNARDAMPQGGTLTIEARNSVVAGDAEPDPEQVPGNYVGFAISDTGTGMPPEIIARVFEPFFTTKGNLGTGLGLSMVHGFVKQSGGHTKIYSEPGRGTTIRMYLPRAELQEPAEVAVSGIAPVAAGRNELILVVEDNEGLRQVVLRQLHEIGYRTVPAPDAAAALASIREGVPIDLLFTDVILAGNMDGRALAEAAQRLRPGLKVLFTSGFTAAAASAALDGEFGSNLLSKPYRKEELERRIRAAIDNPAEGLPCGASRPVDAEGG